MTKVVVVYDDAAVTASLQGLPPDHGREYEEAATIEALQEAIRACGHEPATLALDTDFANRVAALHPGLVFNVSEGARGSARESIVPAWLDHLGIPYTGSDGLTMAVSLDKAMTKTLAASHGVRTPRFQLLSRAADIERVELDYPLFVKPNAEGSNMGVWKSSLVRTPEQLRETTGRLLREYREPCLVEEFAPGRELCIGMLGNGEPEFLVTAQVCIDDGFFEAADDAPLRHKKMICPADVPGETEAEMQRMTRNVFDALRCRDFARADWIIDRQGRPTFLEMNPLPCMSPTKAVFPLQAKAAGMDYTAFIGRLIETALARTAGSA